jgi:dATP pyrophosphohydrolase
MSDSMGQSERNAAGARPACQLKVQVHIFHRRQSADEPSFLVLRRRPEKMSIWQPVTGKVEPGESFEEAARREVAEETGLTVVSALTQVGECTFTKNGRPVREAIFACEVSDREVRLSTEHADYAWVGAAEARARLYYETNRQGLDAVIREISRQ